MTESIIALIGQEMWKGILKNPSLNSTYSFVLYLLYKRGIIDVACPTLIKSDRIVLEQDVIYFSHTNQEGDTTYYATKDELTQVLTLLEPTIKVLEQTNFYESGAFKKVMLDIALNLPKKTTSLEYLYTIFVRTFEEESVNIVPPSRKHEMLYSDEYLLILEQTVINRAIKNKTIKAV